MSVINKIEENNKIVSALGNWFQSQDITFPDGVVAMATLIGIVVGEKSVNNQSLLEGIAHIESVLRSTAFSVLDNKKVSGKNNPHT